MISRILPHSFDCTGKHLPCLCQLLINRYGLPRYCKLPNCFITDTAISGEKLLTLFFYNILRYYRKSPLFCYMQRLLKKGDIFIDTGAYLGVYSYLALRLKAEPHLVEANPACVEFLLRNGQYFPDIYPFAAWNKEEERGFNIGRKTDAGSSSLIESEKGWSSSCYSENVTVRCKPLESIIPENIWEKIKLIKIDVEGAEVEVLQGFADKLGKHKFHIWCEVRDATSDRNPGSFARVCNLLEKKGYSVFFFNGKKIEPFHENHIQRVFDLVFIPGRLLT